MVGKDVATPQKLSDVIQERRSIRQVTNDPPVDLERMEKVIKLALHAPTAFNMQSGRLVVLTGDNHKKLWDITREILRPLVPKDSFASTDEKLRRFQTGAGTILFFENQQVVKSWQEKVPLYKDAFPTWSEQGSAMLQYAVWLALTAEGLGASLQHYNPLIDEQVKSTWHIPDEWKLIGQMPFGNPAENPEPPPHLPISELVMWR